MLMACLLLAEEAQLSRKVLFDNEMRGENFSVKMMAPLFVAVLPENVQDSQPM